MLVKKTTSLKEIFEFSGHHLWWLILHMFIVSVLYKEAGWRWISIPWLPVSLVGTALAFYIGFKNNQAYDRVWEARKIWGSIVNSSRSWGSMVNSYVRNSREINYSNEELQQIKERLIFRHIGWLYTLRDQLLAPTQWEHISLKWMFGRVAKRRRQNGGIGLFPDFLNDQQKAKYFFEDAQLATAANKATQLINLQTLDIAVLEERDILHMRRQLELQKVLSDFYDCQGRAERIKKFPLPRQYANLSFIFNCIFIFLLPLGIVAEFDKLGEAGVWLMIPFGTIVGWIYVVMELIGDYSENPFEGFGTDIPMLSICRTIEIDLLQIIGETDLPKPIQPVNNVLM
jgi:putative membrane protein